MRNCKTCFSTHREEIEAKILDGCPCEEVSRWLQEEYEEKVSGQAIRNHLKLHMLPGQVLPSSIVLEKIDQLEGQIDVENEISKLYKLWKCRLSDQLTYELKLRHRKDPVYLHETRRTMKELRELIRLYIMVTTGREDNMDIATRLSQRYKEIEPQIKRMQDELLKRTP